MKRFFTIMIAAILIVFGAGAGAQATVLTFDELDLSGVVPGTGGLHLDNYAGFIWENVAVVHPPIGLNDPNGYKNGVVSLDNVAYNGFGAPATIISLTSFDFNGVYLTGRGITV
ncbi:hypothetical protein MNBD_DELTA01-642 [hydrothermal vent metagenome]|uniref:PEP-CTERM sorting domain-containing protein n=1 Tax=hydrothermal vent metagenome TaxID=652676 RepID=A0A3B0QRK7_9ZZZZ